MTDDTDIGGGRRSFPETRLTLLRGMASPDEGDRRRAFDHLVQSYWRPVYRHLRLRWQKSNEDAKDLTQAFFARAIEKDFFRDYDPSRSRFRSWLRLLLDGFAANERKADRAEKRGGGRKPLALDFEDEEGRLGGVTPIAPAAADESFTAEWRKSLFRSAIATLETVCREAGRADWFAMFAAVDLAGGADRRPSYDDLARAHGVPATTVTNRLATVRRELRRIVVERLRVESATEAEFQDDLAALLGGDGA